MLPTAARSAPELLGNDGHEIVDVAFCGVERGHPPNLATRSIPVVEADALADAVCGRVVENREDGIRLGWLAEAESTLSD